MSASVVVALVVGLVIGGSLGAVLMGMLAAGAREDRALEDETARRQQAAAQAGLSERDGAHHRLEELRRRYDSALADSSNRKATGKGGPLEHGAGNRPGSEP